MKTMIWLLVVAVASADVIVDTRYSRRPGPGEVATVPAYVDTAVCTLDLLVEDTYEPGAVDAFRNALDHVNTAFGRVPEDESRVVFAIANVTFVGGGPATTSTTTHALEYYAQWRETRQHTSCATVALARRSYTDATTAGRAYVGQPCDSRYATALITYCCDPLLLWVVIAHELGHVFGAVHPPDSCLETTSLMHPVVNFDRTDFSTCSRSVFADTIDEVTCTSTTHGFWIHDRVPNALPADWVRVLMGILYAAAIACCFGYDIYLWINAPAEKLTLKQITSNRFRISL